MEGKNTLENYCYSIKSSISSDEVKYKVPVDDTHIEESIEESIKKLDVHQTTEKEEPSHSLVGKITYYK